MGGIHKVWEVVKSLLPLRIQSTEFHNNKKILDLWR